MWSLRTFILKMAETRLSHLIMLAGILYSCYSLYNIYDLLFPRSCVDSSDSKCLHSLLSRNPSLSLKIYLKENASVDTKLIKPTKIDKFSYSLTFEKTIYFDVPKTSSAVALVVLLVDGKPVTYKTSNLTYKPRIKKTKNLLSKEKTESNDESPRWKGVLYIHVVEPHSLFPHKVAEFIGQQLKFASTGEYMPILYINELVGEDSYSIRENDSALNVHYSPMSMGLFSLHGEVLGSMNTLREFGVGEEAFEELKSLLNTNMYLLICTFAVSMLHLLLDFMAIKTEVDFWRANKSNAGISVTSVRWRCVSGFVILLYLADQKASILILVPSAISLLLEVWKVVLCSRATFSLSWPCVKFAKPTPAELTSWTVEMECVHLMSRFVYPLLGATAVYSLLYVSHVSVYSWVMGCLANGVYCFGFVFMMPQLYINYKLKSVDSLPWISLMYKGVNAFIDDLFVFVIRMPTAHRLAHFRDDIIFIAYMTQRWMYPVDPTRTANTVDKED